MNKLILATALASVFSTAAIGKANDLYDAQSQKRATPDPMDPSDCDKLYRASNGKFFPQAKPISTYKQADCSDKIFWGGSLPNANPSSPGFDKLPLCLGMGPNINAYLAKYPGKCRRLTVANGAWSQDINQKLIWCAGKRYFKGTTIWLVNNTMMSKSWITKRLDAHLADPMKESLFVTASEACFWHKTMGKPFPISGKAKAAETKAKNGAKSTAPKGHGASTSSAHP